MAMIDWRIQGQEISICNCAWGCPCQFNALPTHGFCQAGVAIHINGGHFGTTKLDGLNIGGLFKWPGPIHEGNGEALPLIDERATPEQRQAILTIMSGQESVPGSNMFSVFASTLSTFHEPRFAPWEFNYDPANSAASFKMGDVALGSVEPIRNPITGAAHRVQVLMPDGFEFSSAAFASGNFKSSNVPIQLEWNSRHAHLCELHMTGQGAVKS